MDIKQELKGWGDGGYPIIFGGGSNVVVGFEFEFVGFGFVDMGGFIGDGNGEDEIIIGNVGDNNCFLLGEDGGVHNATVVPVPAPTIVSGVISVWVFVWKDC